MYPTPTLVTSEGYPVLVVLGGGLGSDRASGRSAQAH